MNRLQSLQSFLVELFCEEESFGEMLQEFGIEVTESDKFDNEFIDDCNLTDNEISQLINERELIENRVI